MVFMKTRFTPFNTSVFASLTKAIFITMLISGCASVPNIVPQLPGSGASNPAPVGQDILRANNFLAAGRKREAADAYFFAASNYGSPERERLILQAAELASVFRDAPLTQQYLSPLNFDQLSAENKSRFRLIQAQLALNDRNYREALRILPQRVSDIPQDLANKILATRMSAAQSSGDKLAVVQELVLQEPTLKEQYLVSLNHDRIWNHAQQIPAFQLEDAKNKIGHPIVKNWLTLAQFSRIAKNGPVSKRQSLRGDLGRWIQNNTNHPGMPKALGLLNAAPTTTVTPYTASVPQPVLKKPVVVNKPVAKKQVITSTVTKQPAVQKPVIVKRAPVKVVPKAPVAVKKPVPVQQPAPVKRDPNIRALYEKMKKQIQ